MWLKNQEHLAGADGLMETSPGVLYVPDPLQGSWDVKRLQPAGRGRTNQDPNFQIQPLPHPQAGSSEACCPEQKETSSQGADMPF